MKKTIGILMVFLLVVSCGVISVGATATVSSTSTLPWPYDNTTLPSHRWQDLAAYTTSDGTEYLFASSALGTTLKGIWLYKKAGETFELVDAEPIIQNYQDNIFKNHIEIIGDRLYTTHRQDGNYFNVYDISNPESPVLIVSRFTTSDVESFNDFVIQGNKAFIVGGKNGRIVVVNDISTPYTDAVNGAGITVTGGNTMSGSGAPTSKNQSIEVYGNYIFVGNENGEIVVYKGAIDGTYSYVGKKDVKPETGSNGFIYDMEIINGVLYGSYLRNPVADSGIYALDISNPKNIANAEGKFNFGSYTKVDDSYTVRNPWMIASDGRYLFVSCYNAGLTIYDTYAGLDIQPVGGNASLKCSIVAVHNDTVYCANNNWSGAANTPITKATYSITDNESIGYGFTTSSYDSDKTMLESPAGSLFGKAVTITSEGDVNKAFTFNVNSFIPCKKDLSLHVRGRNYPFNVSVTVNGVVVASNLDLTAGWSFDTVLLASDIQLKQGDNVVVITINSVDDGDEINEANIQLSAILFNNEKASQSTAYSFGNLALYDSTGLVQGIPAAGEEVTGVIKMMRNKNMAADYIPNVILGLYNADNELVGIYHATKELAGYGDKGACVFDFTMPFDKTVTKIKAFVWKSMDSIVPLCDVSEVTN